MTPQDLQDLLNELNNFDIVGADISLWSFRKNKNGTQVSYSTKWIDADIDLKNALSSVFKWYQQNYRDAAEYSILAEATDTQHLHIQGDQTHIDLLTSKTDLVGAENQALKIKDLDNSIGYVLRIEKSGEKIYCIKKSDNSWKAARSKSLLNVVYVGTELTLVEDRSFQLSRTFDMIVFKKSIFIQDKKSFESLLDFRKDFQASFTSLTTDTGFSNIFSNMQPLIEFVKDNMVHLRRMHVVEQKGLYLQPNFMQRLAAKNASDNWGLQLDANGQIIATPETARIIITVLLDHRLKSELTLATYDVPSSVPV